MCSTAPSQARHTSMQRRSSRKSPNARMLSSASRYRREKGAGCERSLVAAKDAAALGEMTRPWTLLGLRERAELVAGLGSICACERLGGIAAEASQDCCGGWTVARGRDRI